MTMNSRSRARACKRAAREKTDAQAKQTKEHASRARARAQEAFDGKLSLHRPDRALQPWAWTAAILGGK